MLITIADIEGVETYEVTLAEAVLAIAIGRKGITAKALQAVVSAVGTKLSQRIAVKFPQATAKR